MARRKDELDEDERYRRDDDPVEAAHGGYMYGMGIMGDGMLIPAMPIGTDPESGNDIPLGANAENVRDDIPAMISEGEYVLPADVVKWYGLKGIIEFQNEARMGLMSMYADDLIQHVDTEADEDDDTTEEDIVVEMAEHTVEEGLEYSDEDDEEYPTKMSKYAISTTPKFTFIR